MPGSTSASFVTCHNGTIRGLVVEKYTNVSQDGAIESRLDKNNQGRNWLIEDNEVRFNHGVGILVATDGIARNNYVHHNGQLGFSGGSSVRALVEGNEVAHNNIQGHAWGWSGGGTKFARTVDLTVRGNYVHDNIGPGIWMDVYCIYTLVEDNLVVDNNNMGIYNEVSYDAIIRNNTVMRNGLDGFDWLWGGQISVSSSRNAEIYNNIVVVDKNGGNGITLIQQNRGS